MTMRVTIRNEETPSSSGGSGRRLGVAQRGRASASFTGETPIEKLVELEPGESAEFWLHGSNELTANELP